MNPSRRRERKTPIAFDESRITDQKRLARGEHLLLARTLLRARDGVHHKKWRVLMVAGGAPAGEIVAIRELMPKARIFAVDVDPRCVELAKEAGADNVAICDLLKDYRSTAAMRFGGKPPRVVAPPLRASSKFDIVDFDLCGNVTGDFRSAGLFSMRSLTTSGGVFIWTFSYGRDVAEQFLDEDRHWERQRSSIEPVHKFELPATIPDRLARRIHFLIQSYATATMIRSVIMYRGSEMPMCSVLLQVNRSAPDISFLRLQKDDFELAVAFPDPTKLYDCPQERIAALRRKFAAMKAMRTRTVKARMREAQQFELWPAGKQSRD